VDGGSGGRAFPPAVAGGAATGLLALVLVLAALALTGDDGAVDPAAWLLLLWPAALLGGALLLRRGRGRLLLATAAQLGVLGSVVLLVAAPDAVLTAGLVLALSGLTLARVLRRDVRAWVERRTRG
jgi:hypothetical protein